MSKDQLVTPVAFFIFNRPDTTGKVFGQIRRAKPPVLLVVADGPRANHPDDDEKCKATRAIINDVDWPCTVLKNYSSRNLGCRKRVSSGLDWVFEQVPEAIVLEDDCLPDDTFFRYCEELLKKYRDEARVMMICGFNPQQTSFDDRSRYFFSKYPHIWGWASWRRAWELYDVDMTLWPAWRDSGRFHCSFGSENEARFWRKCFDDVYKGKVDTWDAQVSFFFFYFEGVAAFPNANLIKNIGFGVDATHTKFGGSLADVETDNFCFPVIHNPVIRIDKEKDEERRKREYFHKGKIYRLRHLLSEIFRRKN